MQNKRVGHNETLLGSNNIFYSCCNDNVLGNHVLKTKRWLHHWRKKMILEPLSFALGVFIGISFGTIMFLYWIETKRIQNIKDKQMLNRITDILNKETGYNRRR